MLPRSLQRQAGRWFDLDNTSVREALQLVENLSEADVIWWSDYLSKELYTDVGCLRRALENGDEWDRIQLPLRLKCQLERLLPIGGHTSMKPCAGMCDLAHLTGVFPTLHDLLAFQKEVNSSTTKAGFTEVPVALLLWTQDTINQHVRFGTSTSGERVPEENMICIWQTLDQLFHGSLEPERLPLRVVLHDSKLWSLDNRRLTVLKMYQATKQNVIIKVPCKIFTLDHGNIKTEYESKKNTAHNGLEIRPSGPKTAKTLHLGADAFDQAEQAYMGMKRVAELEGVLRLESLRDKISSKIKAVQDKWKWKSRQSKKTTKSVGKVAAGTIAQAAASSSSTDQTFGANAFDMGEPTSDRDYSVIVDDSSSEDEIRRTLESKHRLYQKEFLLMYAGALRGDVEIPEELRNVQVMAIKSAKASRVTRLREMVATANSVATEGFIDPDVANTNSPT